MIELLGVDRTRPRAVLWLLTGLFYLFFCFGGAPLAAEDEKLGGQFVIGYRFVDTDGSEGKYRQHLGLEEGVRLFGLRFHLEPDSDLLDRVDLRLDHLGGDPYESMHFGARKYGAYRFELDRRKSTYFYEDFILSVNDTEPGLAEAGDFHTWDVDRVHDRALFEARLSDRVLLDLSFDRYTRSGESTTVFDIQRDEFELDRPIDESLDEFGAALQIDLGKVTLVLDERVRDFENASHIFLPGRSLGDDPEDAAILDFYFLDQPTDLETRQHTLRLNGRPSKRFSIAASASRQQIDLETLADERAGGTGFNGRPFETSAQGPGRVERDADLFDVDLSFLVTPRLALVAGVRSYSLEQDGSFALDDEAGGQVWDLETTGVDLGLELAVTDDLTIGGGLVHEQRDAGFVTFEEGSGSGLPLHEESTDLTGVFASVTYEPIAQLTLDLHVEDSSIDDAFTDASPTDRERIKLRVRYRNETGFYATASYRGYERENSRSGWSSSVDHLDLRIGYRVESWDFSLGGATLDNDHSILQTVTTLPGFGGGQIFPYPIFFESDAEFVDARVAWQQGGSGSGGPRIEAVLRSFENDGSFARERDDFRLTAEIPLPKNYLLYGSFRTVDYSDVRTLNDYEADVAELGFGYRF